MAPLKGVHEIQHLGPWGTCLPLLPQALGVRCASALSARQLCFDSSAWTLRLQRRQHPSTSSRRAHRGVASHGGPRRNSSLKKVTNARTLRGR